MFLVQDLQVLPPVLFPGAKAGCQLNGIIVNNALYKSLQSHINGTGIRDYLKEKYDWTEATLESINWKAHHTALTMFPRQQRVTLRKYMFGWLATKQRRYRERHSPTNQCSLCGLLEGKKHIFSCPNEHITGLRKLTWDKLQTDITSHTATDFKAIFLIGMNINMGGAQPSEELRREWPEPLQLAFQKQMVSV